MMQSYIVLLEQALKQQLLLCGTLLAVWIFSIIMLIMFPGSISKKKTKMNKREATFLLCVLIIPCILLYWIPTNVLTLHRDIKNEQIVEVQGYYKFDSTYTGRTNWPSTGYVIVTCDEEQLSFELPPDWSQDEFPYGYYYGNIIYGKESKIILTFEKMEEP